MKLLCVTDIHLDLISVEELKLFSDKINQLTLDAVMIGGDIGEALNITH